MGAKNSKKTTKEQRRLREKTSVYVGHTMTIALPLLKKEVLLPVDFVWLSTLDTSKGLRDVEFVMQRCIEFRNDAFVTDWRRWLRAQGLVDYAARLEPSQFELGYRAGIWEITPGVPGVVETRDRQTGTVTTHYRFRSPTISHEPDLTPNLPPAYDQLF